MKALGMKTIETRSWATNHSGGMQGLFDLTTEIEEQ